MAQPPLSDTLCKQTLASLDAARGNVTKAAALAGVSRGTFATRLTIARQRVGVTVPTARNRDRGVEQRAAELDELEQLRKENALLRGAQARMSAAPKPRIGRAPRRSAKSDLVRVIWPDSHGAYADPAAMAAFLADLKALDPDEIVMLGDHVDCGGFLAQHHTLAYVAQGAYTYEDDIKACRLHLDLAQAAAPRARIYYIEGNHEARIERWCMQQTLAHQKDAEYLRRAFAPEFLLDLKGRGIDYFRRSQHYHDMPVPGMIKLGKCGFLHDPGFTDPRRTLGRFGMPLVHGHDHQKHALVQPTVGAGEVGVWSFGTLAIKQQLYNHSRPSTHANGYGLHHVARSGHFLTIDVPIIGGASYLPRLGGIHA